MKIALTEPQKPNSARNKGICSLYLEPRAAGVLSALRALCRQDAHAPKLHLSHKALARQSANQLAHFQT